MVSKYATALAKNIITIGIDVSFLKDGNFTFLKENILPPPVKSNISGMEISVVGLSIGVSKLIGDEFIDDVMGDEVTNEVTDEVAAVTAVTIAAADNLNVIIARSKAPIAKPM